MARRERQRKRILILVAVVVTLALAGAGAVRLRAVREAHLVQTRRVEGLAASRDGRYADAMRLLGYVAAKKPGDGEVLLALATSRRMVPQVNSRHLGRAIVFAREAAKALPGDLRPRELLMSLYSELGMLTERLDAARGVLAIDPTNEEAMLVEVDSLRRMGRRDEALARARTMQSAYPDDPKTIRAVIELMIANKVSQEDTLAFIDATIAENPDDARLQIIKVRTLGQFGRIKEARTAALAAADMAQPDATTLAATVQLLDLMGESAAADKLLGRADAGGDAQIAAVVAASRDWKNARPTAAQERLTAALAGADTPSDALLGWSALIGDVSDLGDRAAKELRARQTPVARAWLATLDARTDIRDARWTEAAAAARRAMELDQENIIAPFLLGETERATGDWRAAVDRWRRLERVEPRWLTLRMDLVSALLTAGQPRDAYAQAVDTLSQWNTSLLAAHSAARAGVTLIESGQATDEEQAQVRGLVDAILAQAPDDIVGLALRTRERAAAGDGAGARASLARVLEADRLPPAEDLVALITACRRRGVFGVDELIARAQSKSGDDPSTLLAAAIALADSGRASEADALFDGAEQRAAGDPAHAAALARSRAIFYDRTDDSRALQAFIKLAAARRDDAEAQLALLTSRAAWADRDAVDAAIAALRAIVGEQGNSWKVFQARERLTFDPNDQSAAEVVTMLERVVRQEPKNAAALTFLSEAYATLKDYPRAAEMMSRAVDAQPLRPSLYARLIDLLQSAGLRDQARSRLTEFLAISDLTPDERRQRARLLLRQGMNKEAQADLQVLAQDGGIEDATLAAEAAERAGDPHTALAEFQAILARADRTTPAVVAAANFIARRDGFEQGLATLDRLPKDLVGDDRAMALAMFYRRHGRTEEALRRFEQIAKRADRPDAWVALARLRASAGDTDGAREAVKNGLAKNPQSKELQVLQIALETAGGALSADRLRDVLDRLGDSVTSREALERYLAAKTAIESRPGDADFAEEQLRHVTNDYPLFLPAWEDLATLYSESGRVDDAAAVAREAAFRVPESARAAELAAHALALAKRFDEALDMAKEWRARLDDDPYPATLFTAALLRQVGRDPDALALMKPWRKRIIREADRSPAVLGAFATLLAANGQADDAASLYDGLVERDPSWATRRLGVADQLITTPAIARAWIDRWAPMIPDSASAQLTLGKTLYDLGTAVNDRALLERAVAPLTRAAGDAKVRLGASTVLGGLYEQLGDPDAAQRAYRDALSVNPDEVVALNNLAYLLVRTDGSATEAVELAQRAVKLAQKGGAPAIMRASYLDTLGAALTKAGQPKEAADAYARAVTLQPDNPGFLLGLAESRLSAGLDASDAIERLRLLRDRGRLDSDDQRQRLAVILDHAGD